MAITGAVFLGVIGVVGQAVPQHPAPASLIWPGDARALWREALEAESARSAPPHAWPRSHAAICPSPSDRVDSVPQSKVTFLPLLEELCRDLSPRGPVGLTLNLGAHGLGRIPREETRFENFTSNWHSVRLDAELARTWSEIPPAVSLELRHPISSALHVHLRLGLRRDPGAWNSDPLALNLPLAAKEVHLNEPSLGYLHWDGSWLDLTLGRFPVHWSPSPDFGLALSQAAPYHNAVQAVLKLPRLRYRFLVASLDPWLEGTPPGDVSGTDFPEGSEQWRQRHYPVRPGTQNAHKRVYADPSKTLAAHRLETWAGPASFGITESQVIGGKVPDLRDLNPFAVFHNDFHHGYANSNLSLDAAVRLPRGFTLGAEAFLDDLEWSPTESSINSPSLLGYLGMLRHAFAQGRWAFSQSLHAVWTDPYLYGFHQPLNTYSSRQVLASNWRFREDGRTVIDRYVVDYPLGYLRGGDAFDLWYRLEAARGAALGLAFAAARLSRGEAGSTAPFDGYYSPHGSTPSGVAETEWRVTGELRWRGRHGMSWLGGAGISRFDGKDHAAGAEETDLRMTLGASWSPRP